MVQKRLFLIDTVRGKDFPPGVFLIGDASADPAGIHFEQVEGVDTSGVTIVFSPRASSQQREDVVRSALSSPLVARVAWAAPGAYEAAEAKGLRLAPAQGLP